MFFVAIIGSDHLELSAVPAGGLFQNNKLPVIESIESVIKN